VNTPELWTPEAVVKSASENSCGLANGKYVAARPLGWGGIALLKRTKLAWGVFTAKYDALKWEGQP
jgi:hypothetical protein